MYIVYMAGRPPGHKAKNDARQQLCCKDAAVQTCHKRKQYPFRAAKCGDT